MNQFLEVVGRYVPLALALLLLSAAALYLYRGEWSSLFYTLCILLLTQAPVLLRRWWKSNLPLELDAAIGLFIFLTLFIGSLQGFYGRYTLYDAFLHFQSGFLLGISGFVLLYLMSGSPRRKLRLTPLFISFSAFTFSVCVGALWEVYEYCMDVYFGYHMQQGGLPDTMTDIALNAASAAIVGAVGYFWMRRYARIPMTPQELEEEETTAAREQQPASLLPLSRTSKSPLKE